MTLTVRELREDDYSQWRSLWNGYLSFYECELDESVTASTWKRALTVDSGVFCRVAVIDENVIGFALCILHPGTWSTSPVCYLEDLYVDASQRGIGAGKALLNALKEEGKRAGWSTLYWVTRDNNPARKLYDQFCLADDFVRYRMFL